ncbi:hypothetical protein Tco_0026324 [Tanacetum coccineum]
MHYLLMHFDIIVDVDLQEEASPAGEQFGPPAPKTAKQLTAKRNQERVKSILLLAIPDEYLLKFHNVPNAKSLWAAIKSWFGGNDESTKMQRNDPKLKKSIKGSCCSNIKGRYQPNVPKKSSSFIESNYFKPWLSFFLRIQAALLKLVLASENFGVHTAGGIVQQDKFTSTPGADE